MESAIEATGVRDNRQQPSAPSLASAQGIKLLHGLAI
jgi:hypothetical protein